MHTIDKLKKKQKKKKKKKTTAGYLGQRRLAYKSHGFQSIEMQNVAYMVRKTLLV